MSALHFSNMIRGWRHFHHLFRLMYLWKIISAAAPLLTCALCRLQTSHFTPKQAGEIFDNVRPRLAVIHHATVNEASRAPLLAAVREAYPRGPLVINEDLAVYEISKVPPVHSILHDRALQLCSTRRANR